MNAPRKAPVKMRRCPVCETTVRRDRLASHVTAVHPTEQKSPSVKRALQNAQESVPVGSRRRRSGDRWWTRGRVVSVAVVVALIVLVAYALLRVAPTNVGNGATAPDFTFTDPQGASHSLSSYFGKPIVLWWVATWCSSCVQGTQIFAQQYYAQYHSAGVTFLEIESYNDLGQTGPSIGTMAGQNGYTGQAGWIIGEGSSQGTSTYNPNSDLEYYYVISAQGNIVSQGTPLTGAFGAALSAAQGAG